ncbi:hypothetical protein L9F63_008783, partial [Diploptera punctata]
GYGEDLNGRYSGEGVLRGYRRDGRQNYQMNSSQGYGRSGQQMTMNPWEGGMVPGGRDGLSSSPEAQLALASNLLSTILRPQQSQVPPLLDMDTIGPMGGSMGYRQGGYGGRYDDPGPNRRKRMDARRTDPYNKSMQGRRNAPQRGGADRKTGLRSPSVGKGRSGTVSKSGGKADKKEDEIKKEDDNTNDAEKKTEEEETKREDGEEGDDEKKRDWKDEKKSEEDKGEKPTDEVPSTSSRHRYSENSGPTSRYSGIPPTLLYCHVCKKHMWDENSFQNHLKGRTHMLMMDKLEESYKIKVELMRHEQKVSEQQREIELERMKRQGKKVHMNIREYCTMCDLHFFGNLIVHRKNDRHQQLKNFLHPRCSPCGKEFPTRVEWDHHRLTPFHLRKTAEARSKSKSGDDDFGIEELFSAGSCDDLLKTEIRVRTGEEEEEEIKEADKLKDEKDDENKDESTGEAGDGEEKDGEKDDGETTCVGNLRFRVPKYNPEVAVGLSLLKKMTGQICRACHQKAKAAEAKEKREQKSEEQNNEENSEDKADKGTKRTEDMSSVDDEGNWKRRKVANAEEDEEDIEEKGDKTQNETSDKEIKKEADVKGEAEAEREEEKEKESPKKEDGDEEKEEEEEEEEEEKDKSKNKNDESGDDNIWSEVDQDIGNLLDAVEAEGENESLNEDELLNPKQDESSGKGTRSRNKAVRGGSVAAKATRGRKKK